MVSDRRSNIDARWGSETGLERTCLRHRGFSCAGDLAVGPMLPRYMMGRASEEPTAPGFV